MNKTKMPIDHLYENSSISFVDVQPSETLAEPHGIASVFLLIKI